MNKKENFIFKNIGIAACVLMSLTGVVFAGSKVIENIWKTPEKVQISSGDLEEITKIAEESKQENMTEEKAKEIAINKLNEIGFNSNIVGTNHYKEFDSNKIWYRFDTEDNYEISIDGQTGEFFDIWNNNRNTQDTKKYMTEEQAKELANKYYKLFGYKEGEYEITDVQSVNNEGNDKGPGFRMTVTYNKKYGDVYNPYEYISITLESKNMEMDMFRVDNIPFDNNEVVITENEAVNIALKEDEKIETNKVESTKAKLMVVKMNADAYNRINDKDKYYEAMQTPNYPIEERNYYNVDDRVRKAWVVVINYEDNYNGDIAKRYTEGKYSYFVDATTGEIIGGHTLDYIYSASQR
jgi:predicted small secreted protein